MEFCSNWLRLITLCENVTLFWSCGPDCIGLSACMANNSMFKANGLSAVHTLAFSSLAYSVYRWSKYRTKNMSLAQTIRHVNSLTKNRLTSVKHTLIANR